MDQAEEFVFGFSKLDVMFGRAPAEHVRHPYADLSLPGVQFLRATVLAIDPAARRVTTDAGELAADVLVLALGADLDPAATPGLVEGGHEFYSVAGAFAARDALAGFEGGRVLLGVTSAPFKCPPAPSEATLLTHDLLGSRHLLERSEVALVMPMGAPIPPSPAASRAVLAAFEQRGIGWHPGRLVTSLDPERRVALLGDGGELAYDLFLGVPKHVPPRVVVDSGLTVDGWVPVDPATLQTRFPGVYAVGDVAHVGTPKAGTFAEGQADVVAAAVVAQVRDEESTAAYDGRGVCYLDMGREGVGRVNVQFRRGQPPVGELEGPSPELVADKAAFGAERIARWFGRTWSPLPAT